jgi:hypothetical protein
MSLNDWIRTELTLDAPLARGLNNDKAAVRRVQEWLNLHGYGMGIDGGYGPVTADGVKRFQAARRLPANGKVDAATYARLVAPMRSVLRRPARPPSTLNAAVLHYAKLHLVQHPREVGGSNRGPWVRLYMKGQEDQPWCAGFVTFILSQAAEAMGASMPIAGSLSCDQLAAQGKQANLLVGKEALRAGSIFLVRKTDTDWVHTGFVTEVKPDLFRTVEGNTNDDGVREGYEVASLTRSYASKDFLRL